LKDEEKKERRRKGEEESLFGGVKCEIRKSTRLKTKPIFTSSPSLLLSLSPLSSSPFSPLHS
jgi:hypothetical protein